MELRLSEGLVCGVSDGCIGYRCAWAWALMTGRYGEMRMDRWMGGWI